MMQSSTYLSAIVITYNEARHIQKCLTGLAKVADEIVVVDSFSTDDTPAICRKNMVKFIQKPYESQIMQKQFALSLARYDHVLALDGDESLSDELIHSILKEKELEFPSKGYELNRLSLYCGKWIKHGDWFPDWKLRLWNKHQAVWAGTNPHDKVTLYTGKPKKLRGVLYHFTFESKTEHEAQVIKYAKLSAQSYYQEGRKWSVLRMIVSPVFYLLKSYLLKGGFRDGQIGWQIVRLLMREKWLKYSILRRLNREPTNH